ncbi:hypothetical protein HQ590_12575 [bacterium]|nr:hypothetical protein [bacterium]
MNTQKVVGIASVLVLVLAVVLILRQLRPPPRPAIPSQDWYYDLNTQQLFAAPVAQLPPIPAPSGPLPDGSPAGVRAVVYGCQDCGAADRSIIYLETYTAAARNEAATRLQVTTDGRPPQFRPDSATGTGVLVSDPQELNWVDLGTADGQAIAKRKTENRCPDGQAARACYPR